MAVRLLEKTLGTFVGAAAAGEGSSPRTGSRLVVNRDGVCQERLWLSVGTARWLALRGHRGATMLPIHGQRWVAAGGGCSCAHTLHLCAVLAGRASRAEALAGHCRVPGASECPLVSAGALRSANCSDTSSAFGGSWCVIFLKRSKC